MDGVTAAPGGALVVAGLRGIGRAITEVLVNEGWEVAATTRRLEPGDSEWAEAVSHPGPQPTLHLVPFNPVSDPPASAWAPLSAGLQVVVYCAGPFERRRLSIAETDDALWRDLYRHNVLGPRRLIQAALPALRLSGVGRIITMGYVGAGQAEGWADRGAYAAAKAALASMTRTLALEELGAGVTANMVCPSDIKPEAKTSIAQNRGDQGPRGGDVARMVAFLAAPATRFITGQVIETSFGKGCPASHLHTSHALLAQMLPVGETVGVRGWPVNGSVRDAHIDHGALSYLIEAPGRCEWVPASSLAPPTPDSLRSKT